jgi:O-antigen/teichoic acid export membrane protein
VSEELRRPPDEERLEIESPAQVAEEERLDPYGEGPLIGRLTRLFRKESVRKRLLAPLGVDSLILIANLVTGIIVARALGPAGRGELAATLLISQIAAWSTNIGSTEAISYHHSRHPEDAGRVMTSWLALIVPISALTLIATELLLPVLFAAQTDEALDLARLYMLTVPLILVQGVFAGTLLADEDFNFYNLTRFVLPAFAAVSYVLLWLVDDFTVGWALAANAAANLLMVAMLAWRSLRRYPLGGFDRPLLRKTSWYGLKSHGGSISATINARLDLAILPAFLTAASVGLYSVAINISSILPVLTGTVALMLLPVAARRQGSSRTVILTLQATLGVALAIAIPLEILAPIALELIYGSDFEDAAEPLRLLLPGAVAQSAGMVFWSGMLAEDRPLAASLAIVPGAFVTIFGLIVFLPIYGINAAAILTSVVYLGNVVVLAELYRRTLKIRWRDYLFIPPA